jgi:hypothetical protein
MATNAEAEPAARLGGAAFFGACSELWQFCVFKPSPYRSPETLTVGRLALKSERVTVNHRSHTRASFGILMAIGAVSLFLALPRPFNPGYFSISLSVLAVLVATGLHLSTNMGLNPLLIRNDSSENNAQKLLLIWGRAALIGVGLGTLVLGIMRFILLSLLPEVRKRFADETAIAVWKRVVIAFDSSVLEEIFFRLFLFSLLIWLAGKVWQIQRPPTSQLLWFINALIAVGFGVAHLPQWSAMTHLTLPIVLTVVFLNSIGGLTFGYLFFEDGLESAMIAHFAADLVLHVLGPGYLQA